MEVYLIRHTTPDIEKGICYGQTDVPLKNSFEEEAERVLQNFPNDIEIIFTSPLSRCLSMAELLSTRLNIPVRKDERLIELNFCEWEMKKWNEIDPTQLQLWMEDYVKMRCPAGESYQDIAERTADFFRQLKCENYRRVAVISHNGEMKEL